MALAQTFQNNAIDVLRSPTISDEVMEMAREVGTRLDQRAPGVEFGAHYSGPSAPGL